MAMLDDRAFLVSHIRNSFITSDETGMSELILENEESFLSDKRPTSWPPKTKTEIDKSNQNDSSVVSVDCDVELSHSYDIVPDMDFVGHRRRSNTAQRLEKLHLERRKQNKIKHVQWKTSNSTVTDYAELFPRKEINPSANRAPKTSSLNQQLEEFNKMTCNPFMEFAKYDGRSAGGGVAAKKIDIYLTMAPPKERPYPMTIITLSTAKVQHLIGLICWQYTMEKREPPLKENPEAYLLHMVEDDGEVDMDFPPLDVREPISKFGFAKLSLVERTDVPSSHKQAYEVSVRVSGQGNSKFSFENDSILVKDLIEKVIAEKKSNAQRNSYFAYRLERLAFPGLAVDPEIPLSAVDTNEFYLVRENSTRDDIVSSREQSNSDHVGDSLDGHTYKPYLVHMLHKLHTKTEVQLGISGDKIEIYPTGNNSNFPSKKQKPVSYNIDEIAACILHDQKSSGRSVVRIVRHMGGEFKHKNFECDIVVANEIVSKVNNILEMRFSVVRRDYKSSKDRKRHTLI